MTSLWRIESDWIALGISTLFYRGGVADAPRFINILKNGSKELPKHD